MFLPMTESERKMWKKRQEEYIKRCIEKNKENPPKNTIHKIGRYIWQALWYPIPPQTLKR